jgi:hypothetical protein
MTHTQTGMGQALGVGALISSTFSIYFRRFPAIFLFGFAVYAVIGAISALVLGAGLGTTGVVPLVLDAALNLVAGSLLTSVIVLLAYDAKLGRPLRMSGYVGAALQVILVVLLLSLITSVIIFGAVAIIVGPAVALQSGFLSFVAAVGAVFVGLCPPARDQGRHRRRVACFDLSVAVAPQRPRSAPPRLRRRLASASPSQAVPHPGATGLAGYAQSLAAGCAAPSCNDLTPSSPSRAAFIACAAAWLAASVVK